MKYIKELASAGSFNIFLQKVEKILVVDRLQKICYIGKCTIVVWT